MKHLKYIVVFAIALVSLIVAFSFLHDVQKQIEPSATPQRPVPPPDAEPAKTFFKEKDYAKRISVLLPHVRRNLLKYHEQFELAPIVESLDVLEPIWKRGERQAKVHVQVRDYPAEGAIGLATINMIYTDDEWLLNIFGGETPFAPMATNCLQNPIGSAIAYFSTENAIARKPYIFAERLGSMEETTDNPLPKSVPWSLWSLEEILSITSDGKSAELQIRLVSPKGIMRNQKVMFSKLFGGWYIMDEPED